MLEQVQKYPKELAKAKTEHNIAEEKRKADGETTRKARFVVKDFQKTWFKVKGYPSAFDLLPYSDKIVAATFDPMHLMLIGLMRHFCREILVEGSQGDSHTVGPTVKRHTASERKKAKETQDQLIESALTNRTRPSKEDINKLKQTLAEQTTREQEQQAKVRKEKYAILNSSNVRTLNELMEEVSCQQFCLNGHLRKGGPD